MKKDSKSPPDMGQCWQCSGDEQDRHRQSPPMDEAEVLAGDDSNTARDGTNSLGDEATDLGKNSDLEAIAQRLMDMETENAELEQRLLRARADFENYRRRTRKEMQESTARAHEELVAELLPVLDSFDRALLANTDVDSAEQLRSGVELLQKQLLEILGKKGLDPIEAVGSLFDPHVHDALATEEAAHPEQDNQVIAELRKGYYFGERVLRIALVKVAKVAE